MMTLNYYTESNDLRIILTGSYIDAFEEPYICIFLSANRKQMLVS